eukprot:Rmarinus@m.24429
MTPQKIYAVSIHCILLFFITAEACGVRPIGFLLSSTEFFFAHVDTCDLSGVVHELQSVVADRASDVAPTIQANQTLAVFANRQTSLSSDSDLSAFLDELFSTAFLVENVGFLVAPAAPAPSPFPDPRFSEDMCFDLASQLGMASYEFVITVKGEETVIPDVQLASPPSAIARNLLSTGTEWAVRGMERHIEVERAIQVSRFLLHFHPEAADSVLLHAIRKWPASVRLLREFVLESPDNTSSTILDWRHLSKLQQTSVNALPEDISDAPPSGTTDSTTDGGSSLTRAAVQVDSHLETTPSQSAENVASAEPTIAQLIIGQSTQESSRSSVQKPDPQGGAQTQTRPPPSVEPSVPTQAQQQQAEEPSQSQPQGSLTQTGTPLLLSQAESQSQPQLHSQSQPQSQSQSKPPLQAQSDFNLPQQQRQQQQSSSPPQPAECQGLVSQAMEMVKQPETRDHGAHTLQKLLPTCPTAGLYLARLLVVSGEAGNVDIAVAAVEHVLQTEWQSFGVFETAGRVYMANSDFARAVEYYERALVAWEPRFGTEQLRAVYQQLGALHRILGHAQSEAELYQDAVAKGIWERTCQRPLNYFAGISSMPVFGRSTVENMRWAMFMEQQYASIRTEFDFVFRYHADAFEKKVLFSGLSSADTQPLTLMELNFGSGSESGNQVLLPVTVRALSDSLPLLPSKQIDGEAKFVVVPPWSRGFVPFASTNARLTAQMMLQTPDGSGMRVCDQRVEWAAGRVSVVDPSFETQLWNLSEDPVVFLHVGFLHPAATSEAVSALRASKT